MPFNELTKASIQLRVDQSQSLFQLGLLITGALWALLIAKKDEVKIGLTDPEMLMFGCSNFLLGFFDWLHIAYLGSVGYVLHLAGASATDATLSLPNIFNSPVNRQFETQYIFLFFAVVVAIIILVSAHRLKNPS